MSSALESLEPRLVWQQFDGLRRVPRPSKHEEKIIAHCRAWAKEHGFDVRSDELGNMVVVVPATPGHEGAPVVVIQGHLDMVCEKNADVQHDFMNDPIEVEVDGDWVRARGTTLGADNGLGVALGMAAAIDPDVVHGPMELLLTLDEETGLTGATALDGSIVKGSLLLNLDTEEDHAVYIGCAGAAGLEAHLPLERSPSDKARCELRVRGLSGGHSGVDILLGRGNALKIAAQILLAALEEGIDFEVVSFQGGGKHNAIPRECFVRLTADDDAHKKLQSVVAAQLEVLSKQYASTDAGLSAELGSAGDLASTKEAAPSDADPLTTDSRDRLLRAVTSTPHGVLAMSNEVPGLVETSNNLATVESNDSHAVFLCSFRSSVNPALDDTKRSLTALYRLAGARIEASHGYPGWKPNPSSELVRKTVNVYTGLFDGPPEIKAVHAGLECGILLEKVPGLDAVSFGPEIRDPHSPNERVRISSVAKIHRWLVRLLAELAAEQA